MFIVSLTYNCELSKVDEHLEAHVEYLKEQYAAGNFVASGRKIPRTGGVILARAESKDALKAILARDPFKQHKLATYDIQEFIPSMVAEGLEAMKEQV